jgi:2-polyprenyl-3-methyl-5-hydroxy-6-metoxy-1,4-benzoquinol methylase
MTALRFTKMLSLPQNGTGAHASGRARREPFAEQHEHGVHLTNQSGFPILGPRRGATAGHVAGRRVTFDRPAAASIACHAGSGPAEDLMTLACPVDLDSLRLRREVQEMYSRVAAAPDGSFHFHRGPAFAVERLGYDAGELAALPEDVTRSFAGIANPHAVAPIPAGATVLDIGCGAGTDLLLAARRVGPGGRAVGLDMTAEMRDRALAGARLCGLDQVEVLEGDATALPLETASVDVVISNGVLNLVPEKERAFAEIARVLRPGGRLQIGDIVTGVELSEDLRRDIDLWTG